MGGRAILPNAHDHRGRRALFNGHNVQDILRNDALGENLTCTTDTISAIIQEARDNARKAICFVTGVPGAGKTLVGLQIANSHSDHTNELYSVFLSGNGPLVTILREALARDKVQREKEQGNRLRKGEALTEVKALIQNVHHFRDECLPRRRPAHRTRRPVRRGPAGLEP